jgi:hypothetical protein
MFGFFWPAAANKGDNARAAVAPQYCFRKSRLVQELVLILIVSYICLLFLF